MGLELGNRDRLKPPKVQRALLVIFLFCPICCLAQDRVTTIIQRSVEANNRDWDADPQFDYSERDQEKGSIKTYQVTMLYGTPYERLIAENGHKLTGKREQEEQKKYDEAVAQRRGEAADKRSERVAKFQAERKRDHTMLDQLTKAFDFKLIGQQRLKGHNVYVLQATPHKGYQPPNRDSEVLPGMEGKLWIDRDTFQWVKVEAHVVRPVSIEGFLAEVEPGTQFEVEKAPVSKNIWLTTHFSMQSNAKVVHVVPHHTQEDVTYSNYHKASGNTQ